MLSIYEEGQELAKSGKLMQAVERWRLAAAAAQKSQPAWLAAWFSYHAGRSLAEAQQWKEADAAYQAAAQLASGTDSATRALILQEWAATFRQRNDWTNAERYYRQALTENQESGAETLTTAEYQNSLGAFNRQRGDLAKAETYFRQAMVIRERLAPGSLAFAGSLNNLGLVFLDRGEVIAAEDYFRQALEIKEKLAPGTRGVAVALEILGTVAGRRGALMRAEEYLRRALAISEKLTAGSDGVASELGNLGSVAFLRGDLDKAEEYCREALAIADKAVPGSFTVAAQLNNLGNVALVRGNLAKAEDYYHQGLVLHEKLSPGGITVANSLNSLGDVALDRKDFAKAGEYYQGALSIRERLAPGGLDAAESLNSLADVARDQGDLAKAEEYYNRALAIRTKLSPGSFLHAETLASLAGIMRREGRIETSIQLYDQALSALEGQSILLGGSDELRSDFRARHSNYYKEYIELLISQNQPEQAFNVLERSRAQSLLETLAAAHADIRRGIDTNLLDQERRLQEKLKAGTNHRIRLLSDQHTDPQVAAIDKEIKDVAGQLEELEGHIRVSSPSYAALTQPRPLTTVQVQRELLDGNTLLLEYSLGEDRSFVFAVTPNSLRVYELPKRAEIEAAARPVYDILTARSHIQKGETAEQRMVRLRKAEEQYTETANRLSHMIIEPIAGLLGRKRLLVVADGILEYLPFTALPSPGKPANPRPQAVASLVVDHEIVVLPSASVLKVLRQQEAGRTRLLGAVAVLADPVFQANDSRVRRPSRISTTTDTSNQVPSETGQSLPADSTSADLLVRSAGEIDAVDGRLFFPRLLYSRKEADAILAEAPPGQGMKALDFGASRATATGPELPHYRIVHFATHGLLNSRHPELSGLVLSLVDERGSPQDGFLTLEDIYNLKLPADMVVLSACETGLGKEVQGEGLVGLSRGFMYAGASRIVASLWKVDDAATADLMGKFYRGIFKKGLSPSAALRRAQIDMSKQKRWNSPYYWAGFVMQGNW